MIDLTLCLGCRHSPPKLILSLRTPRLFMNLSLAVAVCNCGPKSVRILTAYVAHFAGLTRTETAHLFVLE